LSLSNHRLLFSYTLYGFDEQTRQQLSLLSVDLKGRLILSPAEAVSSGTKYNVPLLNALVLYVGMQVCFHLYQCEYCNKVIQRNLAVLWNLKQVESPTDVCQSYERLVSFRQYSNFKARLLNSSWRCHQHPSLTVLPWISSSTLYWSLTQKGATCS